MKNNEFSEKFGLNEEELNQIVGGSSFILESFVSCDCGLTSEFCKERCINCVEMKSSKETCSTFGCQSGKVVKSLW